MNKILLVSPTENMVRRPEESYPSGALVLLYSMLREKGYESRMVHMGTDNPGPDGLKSIIQNFRPDILGITMNTLQTRSARMVADIARSVDKNMLIAAGGPHVSALGTQILQDFPMIDVGVMGEGEFTMMELAEGRSPESIPGICFQGKMNLPRGMAENLNHIPMPDLSTIPLHKYTGADPVGAYPSMFIMASRGCPSKCTFCNKSIWGKKVRYREPQAILQEIEWLHSRYGIKDVFFQDDTFNLKRSWAEAVFNGIIENGFHKRIKFKTAFRVNTKLVDPDFLSLARRAGVWFIFYGVESGSQMMLDKMQKGTTIEEIKRAFSLTHAAGIKTNASFIMGLPGETEETARETMALWKSIRPYSSGCGHPVPFPGSELDQVVTEKGHKLESDFDKFSLSKCVVRTDALDRDRLIELRTEFVRMIKKQYLIDMLTLKYVGRTLVFFSDWWAFRHLLQRIKNYITSMLVEHRK